jgi:hypothetical protein
MNLRRITQVIMLTALAGMVSACALLQAPSEPVPLLQLAPAALGFEVSVAQRVTVSQPAPRGETSEGIPRSMSADAVLEVDAGSVRMAVLSLGQAMLRLEWDGKQLTQIHAPGWPDAVEAGQILNDVQLALWPAQAIRTALPEGWTLRDSPATLNAPAQRWLAHDGHPAVRVDYPSTQRTVMVHLNRHGQEAWRIEIESAAALPFSPPQP